MSEPCCLLPHILEQCVHYSRFDFAGESLPQDQSDGCENCQGGAHGPDPGDLRASGATASQSTAASHIGRRQRWQAAAFGAEHSRLFLSSLLALNHGLGRLARGLAWIKEGDGSGWKDSEANRACCLFPSLKKKKNTLKLTGQGTSIRDGLFFFFFFNVACLLQPWDFLSQHWQERLGTPLTDARPMWDDVRLTLLTHAWAELQAD